VVECSIHSNLFSTPPTIVRPRAGRPPLGAIRNRFQSPKAAGVPFTNHYVRRVPRFRTPSPLRNEGANRTRNEVQNCQLPWIVNAKVVSPVGRQPSHNRERNLSVRVTWRFDSMPEGFMIRFSGGLPSIPKDKRPSGPKKLNSRSRPVRRGWGCRSRPGMPSGKNPLNQFPTPLSLYLGVALHEAFQQDRPSCPCRR